MADDRRGGAVLTEQICVDVGDECGVCPKRTHMMSRMSVSPTENDKQ